MRQANILTALFLVCDDCKHETRLKAKGVKPKDVDRAELLPGDDLVLDNDPEARWITADDYVTCENCQAQYQTFWEKDDRPGDAERPVA